LTGVRIPVVFAPANRDGGLNMTIIDIKHPNVLSAELRLGDGQPFFEVMADIDSSSPHYEDMCKAVEEYRSNLPPWKRGSYVHYINPPRGDK